VQSEKDIPEKLAT